MAEKDEKVYQVQGAFGMWHSVPESQLAEFKKQQEELAKSGRPKMSQTLKERISKLAEELKHENL